MHFEITHGVKAGKQLTAAQRTSSLFSEEPRIGAQILRRGSPPMKLSQEQLISMASQIKRLFLAGAIEIAGHRDGEKLDLRSDLTKMAARMGVTVPAMVDKVFGELAGYDSGLRKGLDPQDPPKTEDPPPPPADNDVPNEPEAQGTEAPTDPPVVEETVVVQPEALADTVAPETVTATPEPVSDKKKGRK